MLSVASYTEFIERNETLPKSLKKSQSKDIRILRAARYASYLQCSANKTYLPVGQD